MKTELKNDLIVIYRELEEAIDLGTNFKYSEDCKSADYLSDREALDMIVDRLYEATYWLDKYVSDDDEIE
mgnify:CR=1 FL=1